MIPQNSQSIQITKAKNASERKSQTDKLQVAHALIVRAHIHLFPDYPYAVVQNLEVGGGETLQRTPISLPRFGRCSKEGNISS